MPLASCRITGFSDKSSKVRHTLNGCIIAITLNVWNAYGPKVCKRSKSAFRRDQVADPQCVFVHDVYEFGYVRVHSPRFAISL
jgi:hypothetical protein